jgi:hypothetical protein
MLVVDNQRGLMVYWQYSFYKVLQETVYRVFFFGVRCIKKRDKKKR